MTEKGQATQSAYHNTESYKEANARYCASEKGLANQRRYRHTLKGRVKDERYQNTPRGQIARMRATVRRDIKAKELRVSELEAFLNDDS